ncbi:transglutaminase domain-containing protein [Tepidamorphus sp. 3E244]|uniref:transglutaminase family protein n=1 Tax=Tepidamorphus sp. 3E244 TaxID=3385498 RepID=UPI0038FC1737
MLYDIALTISYTYPAAAEASRHLVRLAPADLPNEQRLVAGTMTVEPKPDEWINRRDFFRNTCVELAFVAPQKEIVFSVKSRVERGGPQRSFDISPPLSRLAGEIASIRSLGPSEPTHFLAPSARVSIERETTTFAREAINSGMTAFEAVVAIGRALHHLMEFDAEATTVRTPMLEAFRQRAGVCQDFAHIMIACLRGVGIPAGYVSGYLRTMPPAGEERMEGADAMHAWVRAWCGAEMRWIEFDPTNDLIVETGHVVVARGRDYSDVAPVRGIMRTSGSHRSTQAVDVVPASA